MITEDYVSFETAKLLREKGFDWEVHRSYLVNDNVFIPGDISDVPLRKDAIRIPTLQMVMKWLREIHGLFIHVDIIREASYWLVDIQDIKQDVNVYPVKDEFSNYEEACEAAIKYCLEKLI